jgi:hypothetical protein
MNMDRDPLPDDRHGIERVSTGVLPPDADVQALITAGYERYLDVNEGAVADYIPALAAASPSAFGVCIAGVQGQLFSIGDADQEFAIEKPSTPATASECWPSWPRPGSTSIRASGSTTWVSPVKAGSPEAS